MSRKNSPQETYKKEGNYEIREKHEKEGRELKTEIFAPFAYFVVIS